ADDVPVRRATYPSTPSRTSATLAMPTSAPIGTGWRSESTVSAATAATNALRAIVTPFAGPITVTPRRCRPRPTATQATSAVTAPANQPAAPRPAVSDTAAKTATPKISPAIGPIRTTARVPP